MHVGQSLEGTKIKMEHCVGSSVNPYAISFPIEIAHINAFLICYPVEVLIRCICCVHRGEVPHAAVRGAAHQACG